MVLLLSQLPLPHLPVCIQAPLLCLHQCNRTELLGHLAHHTLVFKGPASIPLNAISGMTMADVKVKALR